MGVNDDAFSRSDLPGRNVGWFNQRWDGVEVGDDDILGDGDDITLLMIAHKNDKNERRRERE